MRRGLDMPGEDEIQERKWKPKNEGVTLLGGINLPMAKISTDKAMDGVPGCSSKNYSVTVTNPESLLKEPYK